MSVALAVEKPRPAAAPAPAEESFEAFLARSVRRIPLLIALFVVFLAIRAVGARAGAVMLIGASMGLLPMTVIRPEIGLYALILNFVNEWDTYYKLQSYLPISLPILFDVAIALGIGLRLRAMRERLALQSVQVLFLGLYVALVTLSVLSSDFWPPNLWNSFRTGFLIRPTVFFFAILLIRDAKSLHRVLLALIVAHAILMTSGLSDLVQKGDLALYRIRGTVTAINYLSYLCVVTLSILISLFVYLRRGFAKMAMLGLTLLTLLICLRTLSRSGYYALGFTLLFLAFRFIRRPRTLLIALTFAALFYVMTPSALTQRLGAVESLSRTDRYALSRVGLRMALDNPLIGVGWQAYENRFLSYDYEHIFYKKKAPHSLYLAIAASSGFPALLAYLALFGVTFGQLVRLERVYRRARALNAFGYYLTVGLQAALIGHFVFGLAGSYGDSYYAFFILAFSFVLARHHQGPRPRLLA